MITRIYRLQWNGVENAQTYRVYRSLSETGNKQELALTSKTSFELNAYIPGSSDYFYFVKAQATGYQDSDYSTPLRWKTYSISRSIDTGVIESIDDTFVGEGFGYNTGFVAPEGKIFNRALCLLTIGGVQHPEFISFTTDKSFNIDIPSESVTGDIIYSAITEDDTTQLNAPSIAMNADGKTLEITDVDNATSYDVYVDGTLKTNVVKTVTGNFNVTSYGEGDYNYTYIKFGNAAPTSADDWDIKTSYKNAIDKPLILVDKNGEVDLPYLGSTTFYIWGFGYMYDGSSTLFNGYNEISYNSAVSKTIDSNKVFYLLARVSVID